MEARGNLGDWPSCCQKPGLTCSLACNLRSEKAWLPALFDPIRKMHPHISFFLRDEPTSDLATCIYIAGVNPRGDSKLELEVICYRTRNHVQIYEIVGHGHRHYRHLVRHRHH